MPQIHLEQFPAPSSRHLAVCGQNVRFKLKVGGTIATAAFLRTNIGNAGIRRSEIIADVETGAPRTGAGWHDREMIAEGNGIFSLLLPLGEVGIFESRAFILDPVSGDPVWPAELGNTFIKVEPAWTRQACSIYGAFPRLFQASDDWKMIPEDVLKEADAAGWTMIPPSGKLRELKKHAQHICGEMAFGIVMLPPVFPTPTTYARMGRYGSPFAPLDFHAVNPELAEFDRRTTPLDQLLELTDAIHSHGSRVFVDVPINHTGWASRMQTLHPEWFERTGDGAFKSPGAWGIVWEDLVELQYGDRTLWREMADVFLFWCRQGIDGFRCDAGYMLPTPVWEYITAKVRTEFPDTIFLLEGLGGSVDKTLELLSSGGLDWAYSELFQNYNRAEVEWYIGNAISQSATHGIQVHFAETHDNNRLASRGASWSLLRCALSALFSANGAWGITSGVEWLAVEKIDVHGCSSMNWGAEVNIVPLLKSLNRLLATHPAFEAGAQLRLITASSGATLALHRSSGDGNNSVIVLINLDPGATCAVTWLAEGAKPTGNVLWQTHARDAFSIEERPDEFSIVMAAGEAVCLECHPAEVPEAVGISEGIPRDDADCQHWHWPEDGNRIYPWLPELELHLHIPGRFYYQLVSAEAVVDSGYSENLAFIPRRDFSGPLKLRLTRYTNEAGLRSCHELAGLEDEKLPQASSVVMGPISQESQIHAVLTNGRGAMSQVRAAWGSLLGQYDSMLAANLDDRFPVDRRMLFGRCRAWVVRRGFSTELSGAWLKSFAFRDAQTAVWEFQLPVGEGKMVVLQAELHLIEGQNSVRLCFLRTGGTMESGIRLILRPDLEDRGFHDKTVISDEALAIWSRGTTATNEGCDVPISGNRKLQVRLFHGSFTAAPERVTVGHPLDADRGLGGSSDLFSPGFFTAGLTVGTPVELLITAGSEQLIAVQPRPSNSVTLTQSIPSMARSALRQFMVKRDEGLTVIAGYPWFLDWGRDTLIALRGIIAAGWLEQAREILTTFAGFEDRGTLPNMIRGKDASNRETSDAPLWFFVTVTDLLRADGTDAFLASRAGQRSLREVLLSIAEHYISGTPNGIRMDPESGLVFSPRHFTWMDTNYPAGTPREGYPISLQAKWYRALMLLSAVDGDGKWAALANQVRDSISRLYVRGTGGAFLSDCLHATSGTPAEAAVGDDQLRPNQLFAITLGAVSAGSALAAKVVQACESLVVPGAIRTLADRSVTHPLAVVRDGVLLNDPHAPFWPEYRGDEDTRRKPAYHNGTAWPWPFPSFVEALLLVRGESAKPSCRALLASSRTLFEGGCLGQLPEIIDGGAPHHQRGCGAQAWSVSEWLRVWELVAG